MTRSTARDVRVMNSRHNGMIRDMYRPCGIPEQKSQQVDDPTISNSLRGADVRDDTEYLRLWLEVRSKMPPVSQRERECVCNSVCVCVLTSNCLKTHSVN